jgi:CBS domain-containing protein
VDEVMRPLDQLKTIPAEAQLLKALEMMGPEDLNQLPVVSDHTVEGIISRGHIMQLLKTRVELRG